LKLCFNRKREIAMGKTSLERNTATPATPEQGEKLDNAKQPPQFKLAASAAGAPGAGDGKPVQKKDDPLKVSEGQVTFDAEGQDSGKYFSRVCHWPGGNSGVTIGRGYDLGSRTAKGVLADLNGAGITGAQATTLSTGAGLKGDAAGKWVKDNKAKVGEITHDQQKALFALVYAELKQSVVDISEKKGTAKSPGAKTVYGDVDFDTLHPAIMEMLVDLRYRGDYTGKTREWIQPLVVKNDLKGFAAAMSDSKWMTTFGVPKDRFDRRKAFMQAALVGKPAPKPTEAPVTKADPKPAPDTSHSSPNGNGETHVIDNGTVTASSLNVRSGPGAANGKVGAPLTDGTKVQVYEKKDGWLRIGSGQWVSAEFVKLTGKAGESKDTGKPTQDPAGKPLGEGTVTASQLNVRETASPDGKVVDTLKSGAKVTIMAEANGWFNIGPGRWVSAKFVTKGSGAAPKSDKPVAGGANTGLVKPSWISVAEGEIGVAEVVGSKHNPRVLEYHDTTGHFKDDETPWCSSFANWVMKQDGKARTSSAAALSWAKYGKKLAKPAYGAIVVFDHGGGKGHVGFIVGMSGGKLQVLGGNQSNQVKISNFGMGEVKAYVVPADYEVPAANYTMGKIDKVEDSGGFAATR
jgi:uncharacterized protein (TIGR02594 family)